MPTTSVRRRISLFSRSWGLFDVGARAEAVIGRGANRRPRVQDDQMGQVTSTAERVIAAPVATVRAALVDYEEVRPRILTPQFSDYGVDSGGHGAGTRAHWKLAATNKRVRPFVAVRPHASG
jgi:hypothetical protein